MLIQIYFTLLYTLLQQIQIYWRDTSVLCYTYRGVTPSFVRPGHWAWCVD